MHRQVGTPHPAARQRQHPLRPDRTPSCGGRFAEVAGGTTAECAAVCCCCPCGLVNLLVMTLYKLPAVMCRRALRKNRRQQMTKRGLLPQRRQRCGCGCDDTEIYTNPAPGAAAATAAAAAAAIEAEESTAKKVMELEEEMWDRFYSTGFWRSCSQREQAEKTPAVDSMRDDPPIIDQ